MAIVICKTEAEVNAIAGPKFIWFDITRYVVYTGDDMPEDKPVIALPAHKAKIMLLRAGYLETVKTFVNNLGEEAILSFANAPEMHSDNALVNHVLGNGIGLTQAQIYQLFEDAKNIP